MSYSNVYLPGQMSGPVSGAIEQSAIAEFSVSDSVLAYLKSISIAASADDLVNIIGQLVGLVRPLPPIGTYSDLYFTFGAASGFPVVSSAHGFSGLSPLVTGGKLSGIGPDAYEPMPLESYRQVLTLVAKIKTTGLTLSTVDELVHIFTSAYTLSWNAYNDLVVTFSPAIDTGPLYTVVLIASIFAIDPIVVFVQA